MSASEQALQRAHARVGTLLNNKWRLEAVLGSGGMATVYAAVHRNKKKAAIKVLHPEVSLNDNIRERFLREGYVANSIEHPGVVRVDDDDVAEDGAAYLVMELLHGETLDDRAERLGGVLEVPEALSLTAQLLDILVAAHRAGVVHRDLKPENLFLTTGGELKVLDFGIARLREASAAGRTSIGSFMGTPAFMSPEQARGRWDEVDARSDVWAVGATLFTLLIGETVHEADTVNEQLVLAATADAPSIALRKPDLPSEVVELVDRALARDPERRWPDARSMLEQLRTIGGIEPKEAPKAPERVRSFPTHPRSGETLSVDDASPDEPTLVSGRATGAAVTNSIETQHWGTKRRPALIAAGVIAAFLVAIVITSLLREGGSSSVDAQAEKEPAAKKSGGSTPAGTVAGTASLEPSAVAPASAAAFEAAPKPAIVRAGQSARRAATANETGGLRKRSKTAPSETTVASPRGPSPAAPAPTARQSRGSDDPFDRRF